MKNWAWRNCSRLKTMESETSSSVNEFVIANIDTKAKMGEEVCTQNKYGEVSNDKNPSVTTAESDIQGHGFFTEGRDGRFIYSLENHGGRLALFSSRRRKNTNIGACIDQETGTGSKISDIKQATGNGGASWTCRH